MKKMGYYCIITREISEHADRVNMVGARVRSMDKVWGARAKRSYKALSTFLRRL